MDTKRTRPIWLAGVLFCIATSLQATPITGSFFGIASGNRNCFSGCIVFDNEPLTGTFAFETVSSVPITTDPEFDSAFAFGWPTNLTISVFGQTAIFSSEDENYSSLLTMNQDRLLSLMFVAARGDTTYLTFGSFDDSLFTRFDPATFDPTAVDLAASSAHMSRDARFENIDIQLQRIAFDNGPILVSEPSPLALWLGGLLLFGGLALRTHPLTDR